MTLTTAGVLSGIVDVIIAVSKFNEGAWIVVVLLPLGVGALLLLHRQYATEQTELGGPAPELAGIRVTNGRVSYQGMVIEKLDFETGAFGGPGVTPLGAAVPVLVCSIAMPADTTALLIFLGAGVVLIGFVYLLCTAAHRLLFRKRRLSCAEAKVEESFRWKARKML